MKQSTQGYLMILLSAIGFGSYGVWSRLIGNDFGVFTQGWVRSAIVLLILIPIALYTKKFKKIPSQKRKWLFVPVLFGIATQAPLYYAFNHMDIGTATLVFYAMYVITSYIIGKYLIGEKITTTKYISLALAFAGLISIFGFSLGVFSVLALLMAAINGIASGGEVATTKKSSNYFSSLEIGIYIWLGIFITHLPLAFLFSETFPHISFNLIWMYMVGFAFAGLLAFWLVVEGYKYVDASIGGLVGLLEIIFGVIFGLFLFGEELNRSIVIGGMLIVIAGMLPNLIELVQKKV